MKLRSFLKTTIIFLYHNETFQMKDDVQELYGWINNQCNFIPSTSAQRVLNLLISEWIKEHNCSETFVENLEEIEPWLAFSAATLATECLMKEVYNKQFQGSFKFQQLRQDFLSEQDFALSKRRTLGVMRFISENDLVKDTFFKNVRGIIPDENKDRFDGSFEKTLGDYARYCSYMVYVKNIKQGATPTTVCKYIIKNLFEFNFEDLIRWGYFQPYRKQLTALRT